jgi:hypothetical protein
VEKAAMVFVELKKDSLVPVEVVQTPMFVKKNVETEGPSTTTNVTTET